MTAPLPRRPLTADEIRDARNLNQSNIDRLGRSSKSYSTRRGLRRKLGFLARGAEMILTADELDLMAADAIREAAGRENPAGEAAQRYRGHAERFMQMRDDAHDAEK